MNLEHMDSSVTHICSHTSDDTKHPILDVASGPKPGMVIYGHPGRTSEHQTGPTPDIPG